jgi:guanosine-3',5'-bis(diphosphate) 3'-pyrophosphohydrolase
VIAGFLHDTVEDAGVRYDELQRKFGLTVAQLVRKASEDKSLPSWKARKEASIEASSEPGL